MTPLLLLAEARGATEAEFNSTLIGASGIELLRMLAESDCLRLDAVDDELIDLYYRTSNSRHLIELWAKHPEIHRTNVFNIHPPHNDLNYFLGPKSTAIPGYPALRVTKSKTLNPGGSFVQSKWQPELERLGDEILAHNPNLIVALGNCALWALTGLTGVSKLRGTTMESSVVVGGYKCLPTYHPAAVLRNYDLRPTVIADLCKAARERNYPEIRRPQREIWIEPSIEDITRYFDQMERTLLSVDIETVGDRITCIGFAPSHSSAIVIPFDDSRDVAGNYWGTERDEREAWRIVRGILEDPTIPKLFQNGAYDIAFLWRSMKIKVMGATHDTMLLHHSLQPEALKRLDFLGSIYSDESAWKAEFRAKRQRNSTIKRDS
jgi:uracil-DNA glycosylase